MRAPRTILLVVACALAQASDASAQEAPPDELTQTQFKYNELGTAQSKEGRFDEAIASFKLALAIREFNLLHLNLGRSYARRGWCELAAQHYAQAAVAPALKAPTREEVAQVLKAFEADLQKTCSGRLALSCEPTSMRVSIAGAEPIPCPTQPVRVVPGAVEVVGSRGADQVRQVLSVPSDEVTSARLALQTQPTTTPPDPIGSPIDRPAPTMPPPARPRQDDSLRPALGLTMTLFGGALLGVAGIIELLPLDDAFADLEDPPEDWTREDYERSRDSARTLQNVNKGLLISGGLLTVGGMVMWLWPTSSQERALKLQVSPSYVGVQTSW